MKQHLARWDHQDKAMESILKQFPVQHALLTVLDSSNNQPVGKHYCQRWLQSIQIVSCVFDVALRHGEAEDQLLQSNDSRTPPEKDKLHS
jgi:hypothetical protein